MARNEELLNNLKYVHDLMERFAALASACDKLGVIPGYDSLGDYRLKMAENFEDRNRAELLGDVAELPPASFCDEAFYRDDAKDREKDRRQLMPMKPSHPRKPGKPAILLEEQPFFYQVSKRREYDSAMSDYKQRLSDYEQTCARIDALLKKQGEMVEREVSRRSKQRRDLAVRKWEEERREEGSRIRTELQRYEQEVERIDRENKARAQQCANYIAEMQAIQQRFDMATSNGWYPPAFRNLQACRYFIFAVENQLAHDEGELAKVYMEKLRHDELIATINRRGRDVAAACESVRRSIERSARDVTSAVQTSTELLREEMARGNMEIIGSISRSAAKVDARIQSEAEAMLYIYSFDRYLDSVIPVRSSGNY